MKGGNVSNEDFRNIDNDIVIDNNIIYSIIKLTIFF